MTKPIITSKEVNFLKRQQETDIIKRREQTNRRLLHGFLANDEYVVKAIAMVKVALEKNVATRPIWVDIRCVWGKPGCVDIATKCNDPTSLLKPFLFKLLAQPVIDSIWKNITGSITEAYPEWNNPDIETLVNLVDSFILTAFNGPLEPIIRNRWGSMKMRPLPKGKKVTPELVRPELKIAVILQSWAEYKGIDLDAIDQDRMGKDYQLVSSGEKPTTEYGRARKPEINKQINFVKVSNNIKVHFLSTNAINNEAEKWYQARVIRGNIADAASDYKINNDSTFLRLIYDYDHIAGLR